VECVWRLSNELTQTHHLLLSAALIGQGKLILEPSISAEFGLEVYEAAYQYISSRDNPVMKVMIDIGE
jgi:hypothetical protein